MQSRITTNRFKSNKRKSFYVEEDDPIIDELLPKPKWKLNTQFEEDRPCKRARKLEVGSTEVILKPSESKKKPFIAEDLRQYRQREMYRKGIPRDKRGQLRQITKQRANFH